ncbi:MAG: SWIM zinc finger family protein, partial [Salinibacter sp.]
CSCPDWSNPCKHIAAVYLLLAEEFDRDPFLLFRLRGMRQGALMDRIGGDVEAALGEDGLDEDASPDVQPLQADEDFWDAPSLPDDVYGAIETPPSHAPLPKQLGKFPLWRGNDALIEALEPVYEAASAEGVARFEEDAALSEPEG